jgi:hypothetical protein
MLVEDESLIRRAEIASVEIELIGQEEIRDLPERIRADFTFLLKAAANDFTIDTAVEFASKLLSLLLSCEVENVRTRPESH